MTLVKDMPVAAAARLVGEHDTRLWRVIQHYVETAVARMDLSDLRRVAIDETAAKRGQDYITLFVDIDARKVVYVTEGNDAETVARFADHVDDHNSDASRIKEACIDMSSAYIKGVTENLTEAEITFDKFHALKLVNDAVDQVRRAESKDRPQPKYSRYLWLMNESRLSVEQSLSLEALCRSARLQDPARVPRHLQLPLPRLGRARSQSLVQLGDPIALGADQESRAHRQAASRRYSAMVRFQDRQRPHRGHQQPCSGCEGQSAWLSLTAQSHRDHLLDRW